MREKLLAFHYLFCSVGQRGFLKTIFLLWFYLRYDKQLKAVENIQQNQSQFRISL